MATDKSGYSEHLFQEIGLTKREAKEIVELFFHDLAELGKCAQVKLSGYGQFMSYMTNELRDEIQKQGEENTCSARRVVTFPHGQNSGAC